MSPTRLRIALCGGAGSGRRTLLAALGDDCEHLDVVTGGGHDVAGFALALLDGPPTQGGLIVLDATRELSGEILRDSRLLEALGIRKVVVAINKLDLAEHSEERFAELEREYRAFAATTELAEVTCLPVIAKDGDNVRARSERLAFATGPTLHEYLESIRPERTPLIDATGDPELDTADRFQLTVAWSGADPLLRGRAYTLALAGQTAIATVAPVKYRIDLDSGKQLAATQLQAGEIGRCEIELSREIRFAPHDERPEAGTAVLLDRIGGARVGVGIVEFALRRSHNVRWQIVSVDKEGRARNLGQLPTVLWLTGLSGSGKSTIANLIEAELHSRGHPTYLLDGDNVRHGLNADLGFTAADRAENIRRVGEVTRLMVDAGLIVIVSFISPFRAERRMARSLVDADEFIEVFVDTPLAVAEARDPKGLYDKARKGLIMNFTGIDSPYEPPEQPEIRIDTTTTAPDEAAREIVGALARLGRLGAPPAAIRPAAGPRH